MPEPGPTLALAEELPWPCGPSLEEPSSKGPVLAVPESCGPGEAGDAAPAPPLFCAGLGCEDGFATVGVSCGLSLAAPVPKRLPKKSMIPPINVSTGPADAEALADGEASALPTKSLPTLSPVPDEGGELASPCEDDAAGSSCGLGWPELSGTEGDAPSGTLPCDGLGLGVVDEFGCGPVLGGPSLFSPPKIPPIKEKIESINPGDWLPEEDDAAADSDGLALTVCPPVPDGGKGEGLEDSPTDGFPTEGFAPSFGTEAPTEALGEAELVDGFRESSSAGGSDEGDAVGDEVVGVGIVGGVTVVCVVGAVGVVGVTKIGITGVIGIAGGTGAPDGPTAIGGVDVGVVPEVGVAGVVGTGGVIVAGGVARTIGGIVVGGVVLGAVVGVVGVTVGVIVTGVGGIGGWAISGVIGGTFGGTVPGPLPVTGVGISIPGPKPRGSGVPEFCFGSAGGGVSPALLCGATGFVVVLLSGFMLLPPR